MDGDGERHTLARSGVGLAVLLTALACATLLGATALRSVLRESLQERADTLARSVARAVAFPLAVGDLEGLHREAAAFHHEPDVRAVEVIDLRSGRRVRAGDLDGDPWPAPASTRFWVTLSTLTPTLECVHTVEAADGVATGRVRVVVSAERTALRLRDLAATQVLVALLLALSCVALGTRGPRRRAPVARR